MLLQLISHLKNMAVWSAWNYLSSTGKFDPKHQSYAHPIVSYLITITSCFFLLWKLSDEKDTKPTSTQLKLGIFLFIYAFIVFISRWRQDKQIAIYDMFWQCNVSLIITALSSILGRIDIMCAGAAAVALDQTLYWLDAISFLLTGKFKLGVARYLTWKETTWTKVLTATHHLWFIPLTLLAAEEMPWRSFPMSVWMVILVTNMSRLCIPFEIPFKTQMKYMNVNCVHECWKDIKFPLFHIFDHKGWLGAFVLLNFNWNGGNFVGFLIYKFIADFAYGS
ncbi:unnamed protein product [Blepharisma stoltei]|uniref:Uncharacterized protein n=1 Tax=Blepharisma stoltei TaxID=1481888 RepID=A0AAU9IR50_9CILI|nr:unnamed protein product [Blepharisma stoltei]